MGLEVWVLSPSSSSSIVFPAKVLYCNGRHDPYATHTENPSPRARGSCSRTSHPVLKIRIQVPTTPNANSTRKARTLSSRHLHWPAPASTSCPRQWESVRRPAQTNAYRARRARERQRRTRATRGSAREALPASACGTRRGGAGGGFGRTRVLHARGAVRRRLGSIDEAI